MRYTRSLAFLCLAMFVWGHAFAQSWKWARGNTCSAVDGWGVTTDRLGNVFVAGYNDGGGNAAFGAYKLPNVGGSYEQCVVTKYDENGNFLWANGTQSGNAYFINIATDPNNNVFMLGSFKTPTIKIGGFTLTKPATVDAQYFLAKFDPLGNVVWVRNAGNAQSIYVHVADICPILSTGAVATDLLGNVYITVNFHLPAISVGTHTLTNTDPSGATNDILIAKYDAAGNLVWVRSAGGSSSDNAFGITVTPSGDVYIAGIFRSQSIAFGPSVITNSDTGAQAFIARYDAAGDPVWADSSGGTGREYAIGLAADGANNVYLTGAFKDTAIAFSGTVITNPDSGHAVLYLIKFDPANNVSWYKTIHSVADSDPGVWGYSVAVSVCGTVWVSGVMSGKTDIDGHILTPLASSCTDPVFIAGYDLDGHYMGSASLPSGGDDQADVACDDKGNVYLCTDYACTPYTVAGQNFSPVLEHDSLNNCANGGELMYVAKYVLPNNENREVKVTNKLICAGTQTLLEGPPGYKNYVWDDGVTGASKTIADSGTYWVSGIMDCYNSIVDTFKVGIDCDCIRTLFLPNSFTPNGDGRNDIFYPRAGNGMKIIRSFRIYNRWGELIFERSNISANDANNAWDGSFGGNAPLPDVYIWVVDAVCGNDKPVSKKGSVTVIR